MNSKLKLSEFLDGSDSVKFDFDELPASIETIILRIGKEDYSFSREGLMIFLIQVKEVHEAHEKLRAMKTKYGDNLMEVLASLEEL